jgi:undecaprenyl-diphosphatase
VKVRPFPVPRLLAATLAQVRSLVRGAWIVFCRHLLFALGIIVVCFGATKLLWPHDHYLLDRVHSWQPGADRIALNFAEYLGYWGDFFTYNVPAALALWLCGVAMKSSGMRRKALLFGAGATVAGLINDVLRLTMGRPRPDAHLPDYFFGWPYALHGGFQSFPSGHAASTWGAAVALIYLDRRLGLATLLFAALVTWARLEAYRHYPSDVFVGTAIGIYAGVILGRGATLRRSLPANLPSATGTKARA